ncbi:MAG TPA: NAD(P)-binding domain-containing protein [Xanthobacteraceae bacterium]|nr:NAD(P)-binding domain-containing protein [Xanthobacteraceae bacterium]
MKLAIIGAGSVGGTLGTAWAQKAGHEICFGVNNPKSEKTQALLRTLGGKARAGAAADAAAFGEIIVLATPWNAAEAAVRAMGDLNGRIVLDATNPLAMGPDGLGLEIGHSISAGEKVQGWAKGASVFKTLNTTGYANMADPVFRGMKSVMFVAGDDAAAKPKVIALVAALGFEVVDAGPLRNARLLEAHAMLWIELALKRGLGRDWAFAIVRR